MTREPVISCGAWISVIGDSTAARTHLDECPGHIVDVDVATQGMDIQMAIVNVGERDRSAEGLDMEKRTGDRCRVAARMGMQARAQVESSGGTDKGWFT